MPRRIAVNTLNASTIDIINVIRQNASYDYQQNVPEVVKATDIPKVGEVIYGTPAFANQFINALINRIALVRVQSATFNNPYAILKKGYLEFGETVEDIFVQIANVVDYSAEKAAARELKRTIPDVKSAFHTMNWRVMYPITIQDEDLRMAFVSVDGVQNLIAKVVDSVYTAAEYDEFLLFKYLIIKSITAGKMKPTSIGDGTNLKAAAKAFRGTSNVIQFMSNEYNEAGVKTNTPKDRQVIFMDSMFNAEFDVEVLASAFNMEKADFMGRLFLIDNWTSFDNERFEVIRANSDGLDSITDDELTLMNDVKAVILDENWFQVYDNLNKMTENYIGSGLYWNYWYHTWKTVSVSPFANAVVFALSSATTTDPQSLSFTITDKSQSDEAITLTLGLDGETTLEPSNYQFVQTDDLVDDGIAVHPYGAILIPKGKFSTEITLKAKCGSTTYVADAPIDSSAEIGDTVLLNPEV